MLRLFVFTEEYLHKWLQQNKNKKERLTVRLSIVEPTNSIALYVAPDTDISPIIYNKQKYSETKLEVIKIFSI